MFAQFILLQPLEAGRYRTYSEDLRTGYVRLPYLTSILPYSDSTGVR